MPKHVPRYTDTHTHAHTHTHTRTHTQVHTRRCMHTHVHMCTHRCMCMFKCMHESIHACTDVNVYTDMCTSMHSHVFVYIHAHCAWLPHDHSGLDNELLVWVYGENGGKWLCSVHGSLLFASFSIPFFCPELTGMQEISYMDSFLHFSWTDETAFPLAQSFRVWTHCWWRAD